MFLLVQKMGRYQYRAIRIGPTTLLLGLLGFTVAGSTSEGAVESRSLDKNSWCCAVIIDVAATNVRLLSCKNEGKKSAKYYYYCMQHTYVKCKQIHGQGVSDISLISHTHALAYGCIAHCHSPALREDEATEYAQTDDCEVEVQAKAIPTTSNSLGDSRRDCAPHQSAPKSLPQVEHCTL